MDEQKRIDALAAKLFLEVYEAEFGGKARGRFQLARQDLKKLLDIKRLHQSTMQKLIDACLKTGLVVIDMDDTIAFAEETYVSKWRKVPSRLVEDYTAEITAEIEGDDGLDDLDEDLLVDDDDDDTDEE